MADHPSFPIYIQMNKDKSEIAEWSLHIPKYVIKQVYIRLCDGSIASIMIRDYEVWWLRQDEAPREALSNSSDQ